MDGTKERQGDFVFTANDVGEYRFCFDNEMSTFAEKMVDFEVAVSLSPPPSPSPSYTNARPIHPHNRTGERTGEKQHLRSPPPHPHHRYRCLWHN